MDIKTSQATQAANSVAGSSDQQPFWSFLTVRTMKQDLAALGPKAPAAALATTAKAPAMAGPSLPQVSRAAATEKKKEKKAVGLLVKQKIVGNYDVAKSLVTAKKFDEAIAKLRQITSDPKAGWWLKWRAGRLLKKVQKLLITPIVKKEEKPAVPRMAPWPRPVISPLVGQVAPAAPAAPVFQSPKVAVPPPSLPVGKPAPAPEIKVEEKIVPPVFPPSPPQFVPPVIPSVTSLPPIPKPPAAAAPAPRPALPRPAPAVMSELIASLNQPAPAPAEKGFGWKKIILVGAILVAVFFSVGLWLIFRQPTSPLPLTSASPSASVSLTPSPSPPTPTPASALFEMDKQVIIQLAAAETNLAADKLQQQFSQTSEPASSFSQVSFQIDNNQTHLADFSELTAFLKLAFFGLATQKCGPQEKCFNSPTLQDDLKTDQFSFFVYSQASVSSSPFSGGQNEGRLGLVVAFKDASALATTSQILRDLEITMPNALLGLLLGKKAAIPAVPKFSDNVYQSVAIRYLNLPGPELSFDYAILDNKLLIATSRESMYAAIDRISTKNVTMNPLESSASTGGQIVDCGTVGPDNPDPTGQVKNCAAAKFKECFPAKYVASLDLGQLGGLVTYYYEIIGPSDNLCVVKSKFLKNPNPVWVGKEMTCQYDNAKDFETAIKDMSKCSGPLYDLMGQPKSAL